MLLTHTPGGFFCQKMHILVILEIFCLNMIQTSFDLLKKAFATWQHASLSTSIVFCDTFAQESTDIKFFCLWSLDEKETLVFRLFSFHLSFVSYSHIFAEAIDHLLSLLLVQEFLRNCHQDKQFWPWSSKV